MFQICKPYPLHYLHIHLGICLLMQNYPKVQLPSFCHRRRIFLSAISTPLCSKRSFQQAEKNLQGEGIIFASLSVQVLWNICRSSNRIPVIISYTPISKKKYLVSASLIGNLQKCAMQLPLTLCQDGHPKSCIQYCVSQKHVLPTCPSSTLQDPQLINRHCPATLLYCSHIYQTCCLLVLAVFIPKETS